MKAIFPPGAVLMLALFSGCTHSPPPQPSAPESVDTRMSDAESRWKKPERGQLIAAVDEETNAEADRIDHMVETYRAQVESLFAATQDDLNQCYLAQLKKDPSLQGHIVLKFKVVSGGKIGEGPEVLEATLHNQKVLDCVVGLIESRTYPEPYNGRYADVEKAFHFGAF